MARRLSGIEIEGIKRLRRAFGKLSDRAQDRVIKGAVRKAARPIITAARKQVPKETGMLKASLGVKVKNYRRSHTAIAVIGARVKFGGKARSELRGSKANRKPSNYAHLVEYGTKAHSQRGTVVYVGRRWIRLDGSRHPGAKARPFLGPAYEQNKRAAAKKVTTALREGIIREAKKAAMG